MNRIKTIAVATALAAGSLGAAWAQMSNDNTQNYIGRDGTVHSGVPRDAGRAAPVNGYPRGDSAQPGYDRRSDHRQFDDSRRDEGRRDYGRGDYGRGGYAERDWRTYGYEHRWHRGDRLPPEYRSNSYVVDDWRGHHLSAPPRGYHWVQQGNDYLLIAIATGVIASVLLNQ